MGILLFILAFAGMEAMAWFTHKYVMHGFLWAMHRDHHQKYNKGKVLEKNDGFFLIFAIPAIILFLAGEYRGFPMYAAGIGISAYGLSYFLVHDLFIHRRLKIFRNSNNLYFQAIRRAHKMHHKHLGKEQGECFGMLWIPLRYYKQELAKKRRE